MLVNSGGLHRTEVSLGMFPSGSMFNCYVTLPKTNSSPLKISLANRKGLSPNHPFSGAKMLVSGRVVDPGFDCFCSFHPQKIKGLIVYDTLQGSQEPIYPTSWEVQKIIIVFKSAGLKGEICDGSLKGTHKTAWGSLHFGFQLTTRIGNKCSSVPSGGRKAI